MYMYVWQHDTECIKSQICMYVFVFCMELSALRHRNMVIWNARSMYILNESVAGWDNDNTYSIKTCFMFAQHAKHKSFSHSQWLETAAVTSSSYSTRHIAFSHCNGLSSSSSSWTSFEDSRSAPIRLGSDVSSIPHGLATSFTCSNIMM